MEFACVLVLVFVLFNHTFGYSTRRLQWINPEDKCRTPNNDIGYCVNINECKVFVNFLDETDSLDSLSEGIKTEIKKHACRGRGVKVCCPPSIPQSWTTNLAADHSQHRNVKLLSSDCGNSASSDKIVNGNETGLFEFPWAAALKYQSDPPRFACGGSLISNRYVLTAAHCIRGGLKLTGVRLGEHDFRTPKDCIEGVDGEQICAEPHQDFDISEADIIVHSDYNSKTYFNDIALIRLPTPAVLNQDTVSPVCMPITSAQKKQKIDKYTVVGWGATEKRNSNNVLLKALVPRVDSAKCVSLYARQVPLTDNQLCAGGKDSVNSCTGDSGGPLTADYTTDYSVKSVQYGIVSVGPVICERKDFPSVYTRVDKYMGWILDNMKP